MTISELKQKLVLANVPSDIVSFDGRYREGAFCIDSADYTWIISHCENGEKKTRFRVHNESEACQFLIELLRNCGVGDTAFLNEYADEFARDKRMITIKHKIEALGFEVYLIRNDRLMVYSCSIPSREKILTLLHTLTYDEMISFWNSFYPSKTDPGSYVSVYLFDDRIVYQESNHGWSGSYFLMTYDDMADLIVANWDKATGLHMDEELDYIYVEPNLYGKRDRSLLESASVYGNNYQHVINPQG